MLAAIRAAKDSIYLEQYLVSSGTILDDFISALADAASNGVSICMLLDEYGSKGTAVSDLQKLRDAGISLALYNPFKWSRLYDSMRRDHRKMLLVDKRVVFVGGACLSDEYLFDSDIEKSWHDIVVKITGEVVDDWYQSFAQMWHTTTNIELPGKSCATPTAEKQLGRIALANGPGRNQIIRHAITHINKSNSIIWIATPYFLITHKLRRALIKAAYRGVDVRLLLPGDITDHPWLTQAARRYYAGLLENGVRIYEYQPRFIHAKLIICDDWVSVGSSNLDRWNQFWNLDANQEILDTDFADRVRELFRQDFEQSRLIDPVVWQHRALYRKLKEWWSSYRVRMILWLTFFATRIHKKSGLD
jgi:phosphatidylserine/phosphatidylglycerophosphate/cardiolipin synthase-like enzyme